MISLGPIFPEDREAMLDLLTNEQISQTYMLPDFLRREDALPLFHRLMALSTDDSRYLRAIRLNKRLIGIIHDVQIQGQSLELGYALLPDYQGKGYMTQAARSAIRDLFARGYRQITAGAFSENTASLRVMEKAGMHPLEKTEAIPYRGTIHPCIYYSIENQE